MPVQHVQAMVERPEPAVPDSGLVPIKHGKFELSASGLIAHGSPSLDEWAEIGQVLAVMDKGIQFLVGDWIRFGEERYGEAAAQVVDHKMWAEETVRNYVWLSKSIPRENRFVDRGLSMKHHQIVAAMPPGKQKYWLRRAINTEGPDGIWTASRLKAAIKNETPDVLPTGWYVVVRCTDERDREALIARLQAEGRVCKGTERYGKVLDTTPVVASPNAEGQADGEVTAVGSGGHDHAGATAAEPATGQGDQGADQEPEPAGEHARRIGRRAEGALGRYVKEHGGPQRKRARRS